MTIKSQAWGWHATGLWILSLLRAGSTQSSACLSCFLTSTKGAHTPLHTYKHQDKTNSDEQIGHSHHIHPSADSQRHGRGSVGHQYQGQHEEEEPACNSLVSCQKTERKESSKQPHLSPREVPLDSYRRQGKQEERPSLELAGTMHAPKAQRALWKDVVKQVPVLDCWCLCPCPRVLQSYDAKHLNQWKVQLVSCYRYRTSG